MIKVGTNKFFLLSIVFLHLCFFVWQIMHGNYYTEDSFEFLKAAANLKSNFLLYSGDLTKPVIVELFTRRTPLYPFFLAACQFVSPSLNLVIFLQNILSVVGIYLVRQIIMKYGYLAKYDLLFIVLILFTPSQYIYASMIMSDTLFQFFIILMVWFFIKYMNEKRLLYLLIYSVLLGLSAFTKPVIIYFIFANVIFFIWISFKRASLKPLLLSLIPLILLFAYQYRNYRQTGVFEASSLVTTNLVHYNAYYFLIYTEGLQKADSTIARMDSLSKQRKSYKDDIASQRQQVIEIVKKRPVSYTIFHTKGIANFFLDPGRVDLASFFIPNAPKTNGILYHLKQDGLKGTLAFMFNESFLLIIALAMIFLFNVFKLLCFIRFIFQRNSNKYFKGFILVLVFYIAFITGSVGIARYLMPLVPLYIGCGLIFLSYAQNYNSENIWKNILYSLFLKSPSTTIGTSRK